MLAAGETGGYSYQQIGDHLEPTLQPWVHATGQPETETKPSSDARLLPLSLQQNSAVK
jgi:hypothetical protein